MFLCQEPGNACGRSCQQMKGGCSILAPSSRNLRPSDGTPHACTVDFNGGSCTAAGGYRRARFTKSAVWSKAPLGDAPASPACRIVTSCAEGLSDHACGNEGKVGSRDGRSVFSGLVAAGRGLAATRSVVEVPASNVASSASLGVVGVPTSSLECASLAINCGMLSIVIGSNLPIEKGATLALRRRKMLPAD